MEGGSLRGVHEPHESRGFTYGSVRGSRWNSPGYSAIATFSSRPATSDYPPKLTGMLLFSVRGLPNDILLVEKGPNGGVGFSHLRVGKSAMLAARACHELVAYSRIVECLMEADILRGRESWICGSLDRYHGQQS